MMRPRGRLEVREIDMLSSLAEGVGNAGVSTDADAEDLDDAEASEGETLTGVALKTWKASIASVSPFEPVFVNLTLC